MTNLIEGHFPDLDEDVIVAAGLRPRVCSHGHLFIELLDEADEVVAIGAADLLSFYRELTQVMEGLGLNDSMGAARGHA